MYLGTNWLLCLMFETTASWSINFGKCSTINYHFPLLKLRCMSEVPNLLSMFLFFFLNFLTALQTMWDLTQQGIKPIPSALEAPSLNHGTTRTVPPMFPDLSLFLLTFWIESWVIIKPHLFSTSLVISSG